uniref:hypothetical protein n=1 Tax=Cellvibrio fontiphilus TaxID=1815559 RepID=UPI002B4C245C|nr:hypothetical protein [Cellvibrio fontiphilus]
MKSKVFVPVLVVFALVLMAPGLSAVGIGVALRSGALGALLQPRLAMVARVIKNLEARDDKYGMGVISYVIAKVICNLIVANHNNQPSASVNKIRYKIVIINQLFAFI